MAIDTQKYKMALEEDLTQVTEELKTLGVHNPDVKEDWIATPEGTNVGEADPNVGADRVEGWGERRGVLAELETRYNNISRALNKIEAGTYGTCEISGEEIESERLDAHPSARTCMQHIDEEVNLPK